MNGKRASGVLMHLSSLSSPFGIGTMGRAAGEFVDFLADAGQSCWQLLPIGPTGFGDSPYQSFSTFAGNPYFIDLDDLNGLGLLERKEYEGIDWGSDAEQVDYGALYTHRIRVLRRAEERLLAAPPPDYGDFCEKNAFWLENYALFMALKEAQGGAPWYNWPEELRTADEKAVYLERERLAGDIAAHRAEQYLFFYQWKELKRRAESRGVAIIGDAPIYVAPDSADVWAEPKLFQLNERREALEVAGCPPDAFSENGQLWGNPLYDWEHMSKDGYAWWVRRIGFLCGVFDTLRIDHFRGFEAYYAIPCGDATAKNGRWRPGPGMELFRALERKLGRQSIIAEDLGLLTDGVRKLLSDSGFPGMRVLEFAFDSGDRGKNSYLPHNMIRDCVAYIGTHDNDTVLGWLESMGDSAERELATAYMGLSREEGYNWGAMRTLWASPAELTVVQAQDLLGLGSAARMNTPSTTMGNWRWRALPGVFTPELAKKLRRSMRMFGREPEES